MILEKKRRRRKKGYIALIGIRKNYYLFIITRDLRSLHPFASPNLLLIPFIFPDILIRNTLFQQYISSMIILGFQLKPPLVPTSSEIAIFAKEVCICKNDLLHVITITKEDMNLQTCNYHAEGKRYASEMLILGFERQSMNRKFNVKLKFRYPRQR